MGTTLSRTEHPLDSVLDILQELHANLHELETAITQKWSGIKDQIIQKAILLWEKRLAAVRKQDGNQDYSARLQLNAC